MKFEFNTEIDGPKEATALATALTVLYGGTIATALDNALQSLEDEPTPAVRVERSAPMPSGETPVTVTEEPSAAEAFGGNETPAETAPAGEVDSAGIRWDERIHSSTKGTNKDGTWSRRRNTPDALFDSVMAELKGGTPNPPAPATQAPPPPPPSAPAAETVVPPPPTTSTQVSSPTPGNAPITFPILMVKITKLQSAGKIDKATVDGFLNAFDMKEAKELAKATPDTIAAVNAMVDGYVGD